MLVPSLSGWLSSRTALTGGLRSSFITSHLPPAPPERILATPVLWLCSSRAACTSCPPSELMTPFMPTTLEQDGPMVMPAVSGHREATLQQWG